MDEVRKFLFLLFSKREKFDIYSCPDSDPRAAFFLGMGTRCGAGTAGNFHTCPDCSCEALARELGLFIRQVHRVCLQAFGQPFRQLLTGMRMQIAARRLHTTDTPIGTLAEALGYASTASFSAAYKRYFGKPPLADKLTQSDTEL